MYYLDTINIYNSDFSVSTILACSLIAAGILGRITKGLNVADYIMAGFQDVVLICLFILSVSDFCFVIISAVINTYKVIILLKHKVINVLNINIDKFTSYGEMVSDISAGVKDIHCCTTRMFCFSISCQQ